MQHDRMAANRPQSIWAPAACCAGLYLCFCALLVLGDKAGLGQAVTVCVGAASALCGGLAHHRWQIRFPDPALAEYSSDVEAPG
jgi:hypothetical protein